MPSSQRHRPSSITSRTRHRRRWALMTNSRLTVQPRRECVRAQAVRARRQSAGGAASNPGLPGTQSRRGHRYRGLAPRTWPSGPTIGSALGPPVSENARAGHGDSLINDVGSAAAALVGSVCQYLPKSALWNSDAEILVSTRAVDLQSFSLYKAEVGRL
jgi:hypothetical protein